MLGELNLQDVEIVGLAYDTKIKLVEQIAQELLRLQVEFAEISGRYAELRAEITVLKEARSAIQSALRAERDSPY